MYLLDHARAVRVGAARLVPARVVPPSPSREVLDALEGADAALLSLAAFATVHRHLTCQENAVVELAVERERIRQEFRRRDATVACGTITTFREG